MTECEVGLVGVQARILQLVRVELGVQADAPPFLAQVQQVAADAGDALDRLAQLGAAVAALAAENVAGKAFAVQPDERRRRRIRVRARRERPVAETQRQVFAAVDQSVEREHPRRRGVPVDESQRHRHLCADRRGRRHVRHGHPGFKSDSARAEPR